MNDDYYKSYSYFSLGQSVHLVNESEFCDIIVTVPLPPEGTNSGKASDKNDKNEKSVSVKPLKTFIGESNRCWLIKKI